LPRSSPGGQSLGNWIRQTRVGSPTLERPIATYSWGTIAGLADPFGHGVCILQFSARGYDAIATPVSRP